MTDWSKYKNKMPPSGGGDLLKLEDGKGVKIRVVGEPYVVQTEYKGTPSTRFALKFWNQSAKIAQFIMIPKTPLNALLALAENTEDWGDPEQYDVTITRTGSGKETEYSVQPSPNKGSLDKAKRLAVEAVDLEASLKRFPSISLVIPLADVSDEFWSKHKPQPRKDEPSLSEIAEEARLERQQKDTVIENLDGEPMDLEEIPF